MTAKTLDPSSPPVKTPFGLKAIVGLLILQMLVQVGLVALNINNPYPEVIDMADVALFEVGVLIVQILWTLWVVIGVWTRRRWVWYWMMLLLAYSLANGLRSYFWAEPNYITMCLNVLMVLYLNQSDVQKLFLHPSTEEQKN